MEKRGQAEVLQITLLFEFIAGILIAGILIYAMMNLNEASQISEEYLNKDYGIIKGELQGKVGDYKITYPIGTFTVKDNQFQKPTGISINADNNATITKDSTKIEIK